MGTGRDDGGYRPMGTGRDDGGYRLVGKRLLHSAAKVVKTIVLGDVDIEDIERALNEIESEREQERQRRIHYPPGSRLLGLADFIFSGKTFSVVFEPIVTDLRDEYIEAYGHERLWKARWVQIRGYWSFWSAVFAQVPLSLLKRLIDIWKAMP